MNWLLLLSLATAIPSPPPGVQGFVSAEDLMILCEPQDDSSALCLGYLVGALDQLLARQARRPAARHTLCLPKGLTAEMMRDNVMDRVARDPRRRPQAAAEAIRQAVEAEYPCRASGAPDAR
ncbi:MAG: Rap1a/Tai family immunity protein [Phenylobacterium sp.]|uniref:Rap1a/Tai family immunity protein n=1 Tax=Phenylobacterium sp. TaxID=1871053 RepID=UPI003BB73A24